MGTLNLYNEGSQKSESRENEVFLPGAIAGEGDIEEKLGRYLFFPFLQTPKKCMQVKILQYLRGNLILLRDMGICYIRIQSK